MYKEDGLQLALLFIVKIVTNLTIVLEIKVTDQNTRLKSLETQPIHS